MTLFELKEKLFNMHSEIGAIDQYLAEKAADPNTPMKDIEDKQAKRAELVKRLAILQEQHDSLEKQQRDAVALQKGSGNGLTEKDVLVKNKAALYRAIAHGDKEGAKKTYQGLGAIPAGSADLGSGSNLLPSTLSNEIIVEPIQENSLRLVEQTSQIAGLEEPRVEFGIDDEDLLEDVIDAETAKEIEASSDLVTYGRYKTKLKISVADTVIY
ncbi:MAG TPA: hypothetical protein PKB13_08790, partial [Clostridia bacterium]|nr:hypothetical protein [Clostridia bacterium]